jgi:ribosome-associated toxin RatA of RatAB toxin-antitoxin module
MTSPRHISVISSVAATILLFGAPLTLAQVPRWTTDEREDIESGELATRGHTEQRGELALVGGSSWQRIDAPPERSWRAVRDIERYQHMLPLLESATVIQGSGDDIRVRMQHSRGPINIRYHLRMRFDNATRTMRFQLDDRHTNDVRAAWGYARVDSWPDGGTLFSWGVMGDFGSGLLTGLMRPLVRRWMLRIPSTFKSYIEGWGGRNYASR